MSVKVIYKGYRLYIYICVCVYIYVTFHSKEAKYTFFSNAHGTFSKIDHMIGHKTRLDKFNKIEIISSIFLDHRRLKLETNLKKKLKNIQTHED